MTLDHWLRFQIYFAKQLAIGMYAFLELVWCAESLALPLPLIAVLIPLRLEGIILYRLEFCIAVPGAISALNRLQAELAKHVLGIPGCREGAWCLVIAECGWTWRLGTRLWERTLMLLARVHLLPAQHPASQLLRIAAL